MPLLRPYRHGHDSIPEITRLLHEAYAEWAARGLRFVATWQDDAITEKRLTTGHAFVLEFDGRIVGTITTYPSRPQSACPYYHTPGVWSFGQLAVAPPFRGHGHAARLIRHCEELARAQGAREMALDTGEGATRLIRWYERLGYTIVGSMDWEATNYVSVILAKRLTAA